MRTYITSIISFLVLFSTLKGQNTTQSVLSEGEIYKMAIETSGLYKLTYDFLKANTAINLDAINPANLRIYGNRGGLLPLKNNEARADDLIENPIYLKGGNDGSFDPGDYLLFYAEGADRTTFMNDNQVFEKNIYDFNNYYFLKLTSSPGKQVELRQGPTSTAFMVDYSEKIYRHENDLENLLGQFASTQGSGKKWFGENFSNDRQQDFDNSFRMNEVLADKEVELSAYFVARSPQTSRLQIQVGSQEFMYTLGTSSLGNLLSTYAKKINIKEQFLLNENNPKVSLEYLPTASNSEAWLDYIQLKVKERNIFKDQALTLINPESASVTDGGFNISGPSNLQIWDITELGNISSIDYTANAGTLSFAYNTQGQVRTFIAFDPNQENTTPRFVGKVENQNIHSIERADMVIIYYKDFLEAAQKIANHRSTNDGLRIELVDVEQLYNEFASGRKDPVAIRDMARMVHLRDPNFKYLLLLGDASYDYRGINKDLEYQNFVPSYQTDLSLNPIDSHPSDDYFGLLSDEDGANDMSGDLDIGIGRIPCKTLDEALAVVDKIIGYDTNPDRFGNWRTKIGFSADDVDSTGDLSHMKDADEIARNTEAAHPCLIQNKTYLDAYVQEATPGGARYPAANKALSDNIFKGELVWSYLGHGGPKGLSQERVLQIADVRNWSNIDKLPIFITATCTFTGFDEPSVNSAGEYLILNPNGGAVALFTTVRAVYANSNKALTKSVYTKIFARENNGKPLRLGDVLMQSQNESSASTTNTRKFLLMGDPSMRIALPEYKVMVTEINGKEAESAIQDTLGALGKANLKGQILSHGDNSLINNFNGTVSLTIYDKPSQLSTLVNDGIGSPIPFNIKKNILYKGTATVTNGEFELDFILPQDINFSYGPGTLNFYAYNGETDATGCYDKLIIGGASSTAIDDNEGPEVKIFFNDRSFEFGGEVNPEPILLVDLTDENGINLSSNSIGHDITATLEDQNGERIVLNDFYEPTVDKVGSGTVTYEMPKLEPGPHKIYLKAWDILNNSTEEVSEFVVTNNQEGYIEDVLNYPNPFSTRTDFTFNHDLSNANLDIVINIYTISGKLVKSITDNRYSSGTRIDDISWDARDDYGNKLAKGIYLYKINLYAPELDVSRESDFMKLAIIY